MSSSLPYKHSLTPDNHLELWKYFSDDAAKIKDRMWTIASLFFAAITTLVGFMAKLFSKLDRENILQGRQIMMVIIISVSLWGLCYYFKYLITQYGIHLRFGWNRTNFIRTQIEGLSEIWHTGNEQALKEEGEMPMDTSLPKEAKRLIDFSNFILKMYALFLTAEILVIFLS